MCPKELSLKPIRHYRFVESLNLGSSLVKLINLPNFSTFHGLKTIFSLLDHVDHLEIFLDDPVRFDSNLLISNFKILY